MAEKLLEVGADVSCATGDGNTLLHWGCNVAVCRNSVEVVEKLLAAGADVSAKNDYGATPLHVHVASRRNSVEVVEMLLSAGAAVDAKKKNGGTPLHDAFKSVNSSSARELLAAGEDIGATNGDETPLDLLQEIEPKTARVLRTWLPENVWRKPEEAQEGVGTLMTFLRQDCGLQEPQAAQVADRFASPEVGVLETATLLALEDEDLEEIVAPLPIGPSRLLKRKVQELRD